MSVRSGIAIMGILAVSGGVVAAGMSYADHDQGSGNAQVQRNVVNSVALACPELRSGSDTTTSVALTSVPGVDGQSDEGSFSIVGTPGAATLGDLASAGSTAAFPTGEAAMAVATALDGLAPGSFAARTSVDSKGEGRGLANVQCTGPITEAWLLGGATQPGQRGKLVLVNPTDSDAVAEVTVVGIDGAVETSGTDGVAVPANDRAEVKLDAVAPGMAALAVHVTTRFGLVSPFIVDDRMEDLTPRGIEIIPPSGRPARRSIITGLPSGPGTRELLLLSPSERANVQVTAITQDGLKEVAGGQSIPVRGERLRTVDLSKQLGDSAATIVITSDVPVLASANMQTREEASSLESRKQAVADAQAELDAAKKPAERRELEIKVDRAIEAARDDGSDIVWLRAGERLTSTGVAGGVLPNGDTVVTLIAIGGDSRASVSRLSGSEVTEVDAAVLPEGEPVEVSVSAEGKEPYSLLVSDIEGAGDVYATFVQRSGHSALTGYPLERVSPFIRLPDAQSQYGLAGSTRSH